MAEFSFVAPILAGKTDAWRKAVAEINGPRNAAYKESRKSTSDFDTWFRETVLVGVHGFDPKAAPPPPVTVMLDHKG